MPLRTTAEYARNSAVFLFRNAGRNFEMLSIQQQKGLIALVICVLGRIAVIQCDIIADANATGIPLSNLKTLATAIPAVVMTGDTGKSWGVTSPQID